MHHQFVSTGEDIGNDGFADPAHGTTHGKMVRRSRLSPPYPEHVSMRLHSHTVEDEFEAYHFLKSHTQKSLVASVWADGTVWGVHTVALWMFLHSPSKQAQGRALVGQIAQEVEDRCDSILRMLQAGVAKLQPDQGIVGLPAGLYDPCHAVHHYLASLFVVRNASPGANTLGRVFAFMEALPSEWDGLKTGTSSWLDLAKFASPLGADDPYLKYDGRPESLGQVSLGRQLLEQTSAANKQAITTEQYRNSKTPPTDKGPKKKNDAGPGSPPKEKLTPETLARTAAQRAKVPANAMSEHLCMNCGDEGHNGWQCILDCIRCNDVHSGVNCPKNQHRRKGN